MTDTQQEWTEESADEFYQNRLKEHPWAMDLKPWDEVAEGHAERLGITVEELNKMIDDF